MQKHEESILQAISNLVVKASQTSQFIRYVGENIHLSFDGEWVTTFFDIFDKYYTLRRMTWESGWPSGLRRYVQVVVYESRRGFESHF